MDVEASHNSSDPQIMSLKTKSCGMISEMGEASTRNGDGNGNSSMIVDPSTSFEVGREDADVSTSSGILGAVLGADCGAHAILEQFLILARTAKGASAVQLVKDALEVPGLYVFAELLNVPNISELSQSPDHSAYYRLLEVFAYGIYDDYVKNISSLPPLSPRMVTKLRHLTIVTLASSNKTLPLDILVKRLGLDSQRELEDLIIEAIYADVLHGKLDQKNSVLEVDYALGRDIKAEDLPNIASTLKAWCDSCNSLLVTLDGLVVRANKEKEASIQRSQLTSNKVAAIKTTVKRQLQAGVSEFTEDGVCPTDGEKKYTSRVKKTASGGAGAGPSTGTPKTTSKFWPKS